MFGRDKNYIVAKLCCPRGNKTKLADLLAFWGGEFKDMHPQKFLEFCAKIQTVFAFSKPQPIQFGAYLRGMKRHIQQPCRLGMCWEDGLKGTIFRGI